MAAIVLKSFNGLKPIIKARLLGDSEAQVAQNVRLVSGSLEPLRGVSTLKATVLTAPKTIFRYGNSSSETDYWLEFLNDTDVMRSPVPEDQYDRLYWTDGINPPRYAPNSKILSGSNYPGAFNLLGIPAPTTKPGISSFSAVVNYTVVTREYVLTFYNPTTNKESLPGPITSVQAVDGEKVAFTNLPTNNQGDAGITKKRLYRKVSTTFRRVAEIDLAATSYDDLATDASLANATVLASAIASAPRASAKAPTVTAGAATSTAAAVSRSYVYTIKNFTVTTGLGESTNTANYAESGASSVVTVSADSTQSVTLSGLSNSLGGTHFRLYRKDAGSASYQFVAEFPVSQTSVTDNIRLTVLGGVLQYDGPVAYSAGSAPAATVGSSSAVSTVNRVYMVTYLDAVGNESGKGPASSIVSVIDGQTAASISHTETLPAGVSKKRIYRQTVTSLGGVLNLNDANWRLVAEVTANTTSSSDSAPESSLTVTLSTALQALPVAPGSSPTSNAVIPPKIVPETRIYVYTYVSAYGEEGEPSPVSDAVEIDGSLPVTLTMAGAPSGAYEISLKRIYRSSTVGNNAQFQFVAEVPVAQGSYTDGLKQAELGEVLPTEGWIPPPAGLKGLRLMANGAAVGFVGRTVYFSEPNLPHAWPHKYTIDFDIVGIATYGQTVAVMTTSYPFLVQGADPAAMTPTRLELPQACVSKRSILETGDGVIYASPDGLVALGTSASVMTEAMMSRDIWQTYSPETMQVYLCERRVHCFYTAGATRGCLVFDLTGQGAPMTTTDIPFASAVTAGFFDAKTDTLYLVQGGSIVRFDRGSALTATWKSKLFRLPFQSTMSVGQVRAAAYPVTLKVFADGTLRHTQTVSSSDHFRLPGGFRALDWELQVETKSEVSEVIVASSVSEVKSV
jgi:hypothetical protein